MKQAYIRTSIDARVKDEADHIFHQLGLKTSEAIRLFLIQVKLRGGLPFRLEVPRALSICAPITTAYRNSAYEVDIGKLAFLRQHNYVNVQGLQAIQHHELSVCVGFLNEAMMDKIKATLRYTFAL
jgi:addiction module RelB/DinJ family antitoxin